ncbi:hypothetical protein CDD83_1883 [Cordyceps sp. RAO-2017]|nr:hypothetical protein CDD83_1883 [Cordyceps sp. RAO-2017]
MDRSVQLQQVPNFRDVGQTVNGFLGRKLVREGVLFRSAYPDGASPQDKIILRDELGIRTIIDLRSETEQLRQAGALQAGTQAPTPWYQWKSERPRPPRIRGIDYREIRITGRSFERHVVRQLAWLDFFKVIFFFVFGYRLRATRIIVREVLVPIGLLGIGTVALDNSSADIYEALKLLTSPRSTPALVHCTLGKDRTGLICALILIILGVPMSAIEYDYFQTDAALFSSRAKTLAELHDAGFTEEWASTAKNMITGIVDHLSIEYGGVDAYLDQIGFHESDRAKLRDRLLQ